MSDSEKWSGLVTDLVEAGMNREEAAGAARAMLNLYSWPAPALEPGSAARLVGSLTPAIRRRLPTTRQRLVRACALGGIAAALILATAFAASPKLRSTVTGWFGSGATVGSPLVLGSVDFLNPRLGFVAVGNTRTHQGYLYKTTNTGRRWRLSLRFRTGGDLPNMGLLGTSLTFLNRQVGFLYTARGSPAITHKRTHIRAVLQRTVDGGRSWTHVKLPHEPWQIDASLSFVSKSEAWYSVGAWGSVSGQTGVALFHTANAGRTWKEFGGIFRTGTQPAIHFVNRTDGWLFSSNFTGGWAQDSVTRNSGQTWHPCGLEPGGGEAYGHWCTSPTPPAHFYQPNPRSPSSSSWVDVTHLDSGDFFGGRGLVPVMYTLLRTHSIEDLVFVNHLNPSGDSWTRATRVPLHVHRSLRPAVDIESARAWFFAGRRHIVYTLDGGNSWTRLPSPLPRAFTAGGIRFFGKRTGLVWGGTSSQRYSRRSVLERTDDGGRTWRTVKLPVR